MNEMHDGVFSGGPIDHLKQGWASMPLQFHKPHYWKEDTDPPQGVRIGGEGRYRYYNSLCGLAAVTSSKVPALGAGSYQVCKRCLKKASKQPNARDRLTFLETENLHSR